MAQDTFERHKRTMCEQLERAHADIQLRQDRSERLIKTFEQRLDLRQKQNVDYREKIDTLSAAVTAKKSALKKQSQEMEQIKDQLKRCQHTVTNAQSLNETLLQEKAVFDSKVEERDREIEDVTAKHNQLQMDLAKCIQERMNAIKTSKRMRLAEEKAHSDMMEWKTRYNELEETSQRIQSEMDELKKSNETLEVENSKLAGHHNAQQRINHLLNLKRECEKLKREKKQVMHKLTSLQKKVGREGKGAHLGVSSQHTLNVSMASNASSVGSSAPNGEEDRQRLKEQLTQMSASKEEMAGIVTSLMGSIRNISELAVVEESMESKVNPNSVEQHVAVLNTIQTVIHDQNNQVIKLKREVNGLQNDISIRDEQIKLMQDQVHLSPTLRTKARSRTASVSKSHRRKRRSSSSFHLNSAESPIAAKPRKKRPSTDNS